MSPRRTLGGSETVNACAALSDPNRYRILELLASKAEAPTISELCEEMSITPSLMSHHLDVLEQAGIIKRERKGLHRMVTLQRAELRRRLEPIALLVGHE